MIDESEAPSGELDPFGLTANLAAYEPADAIERALASLEAALASGAAVTALTGPPGLGKTLLLHRLAERSAAQHCSLHVPYGSLSAFDLCGLVLGLLGRPPTEDPIGALQRFAAEQRQRGSDLLLLLDDASCIPKRTAARLAELVAASEGALRIVLAGLEVEGLREVLAAFGSDVVQVRLTEGLTHEETRRYIERRLALASVSPEMRALFDDPTIAELYRASRGVPRALHTEAWAVIRDAARGLRGPGSGSDEKPEEEAAVGAEPVAPAPESEPEPEPESEPERESEPETTVAPATESPAAEPPPVAAVEAAVEPASEPRDEEPVEAESAPQEDEPVAAESAPQEDEPVLAESVPEEHEPIRAEPALQEDEPLEVDFDERPRSVARRVLPVVLSSIAAGVAIFAVVRGLPEQRRAEPAATPNRDAPPLAQRGWDLDRRRPVPQPVVGPEQAEPVAPEPSALVPAAPPAPVPETLSALPEATEPAPEIEAAAVEPAKTAPEPVTTPEVPTPSAPGPIADEAQREGRASDPVPTPAEPAIASVEPPAPVVPQIETPPTETPSTETPSSEGPTRPVEESPPPAAPVEILSVSINATPWAVIEVDGRELGETPLAGVKLPAGPHTFRARMPDGSVREKVVEVDAVNRFVAFD